ncbi:unnamed protein product, partial [Mesorhabditis spiculigera]
MDFALVSNGSPAHRARAEQAPARAQRGSSPGRAIRGQSAHGTSSPPPLDPSEDTLEDEDMPGTSYSARKIEEKRKKKLRVTFDLPSSGSVESVLPSPQKMQQSSSAAAQLAEDARLHDEADEFAQAIHELTVENEHLRNVVEEQRAQLAAQQSRLADSEDQATRVQKDNKSAVAKARVVAQARIKDLEDKMADLNRTFSNQVETLQVENETLRSSREWEVEENARMRERLAKTMEKNAKLHSEVEAALVTNCELERKMISEQEVMKCMMEDLEDAERIIVQQEDEKTQMAEDIELMRGAIIAQEQFIEVLEADIVIYEEHIGILRESLGASKVDHRDLIRSKAFEAKLKALEEEKQEIARTRHDERLKTKALNAKVRLLEGENEKLMARICEMEMGPGQEQGAPTTQNTSHHLQHELAEAEARLETLRGEYDQQLATVRLENEGLTRQWQSMRDTVRGLEDELTTLRATQQGPSRGDQGNFGQTLLPALQEEAQQENESLRTRTAELEHQLADLVHVKEKLQEQLSDVGVENFELQARVQRLERAEADFAVLRRSVNEAEREKEMAEEERKKLEIELESLREKELETSNELQQARHRINTLMAQPQPVQLQQASSTSSPWEPMETLMPSDREQLEQLQRENSQLREELAHARLSLAETREVQKEVEILKAELEEERRETEAKWEEVCEKLMQSAERAEDSPAARSSRKASIEEMHTYLDAYAEKCKKLEEELRETKERIEQSSTEISRNASPELEAELAACQLRLVDAERRLEEKGETIGRIQGELKEAKEKMEADKVVHTQQVAAQPPSAPTTSEPAEPGSLEDLENELRQAHIRLFNEGKLVEDLRFQLDAQNRQGQLRESEMAERMQHLETQATQQYEQAIREHEQRTRAELMNGELQQRVSELETKLFGSSQVDGAAEAQAREERMELNAQIRQLQATIQQLDAQRLESEGRFTQLAEELEAVRAEASRREDALNTEIGALEADKAEFSFRADAAEESFNHSELHDTIRDLQKEVDQTKYELVSMRNELEASEEVRQQLQYQLDEEKENAGYGSGQECVNETSNLQERLGEDVERLEELRSELEGAVDGLKGEVWALNGQLKASVLDREALDTRLAMADSQLAAEKARADQLDQELSEQVELTERAQRQAAESENESNRRLAECLEMESRREELEKAYTQLKEYYTQLHASYEALYNSVHRTEKVDGQTETDVDGMTDLSTADLGSLRESITAEIGRIHEATARIVEVRAQLSGGAAPDADRLAEIVNAVIESCGINVPAGTSLVDRVDRVAELLQNRSREAEEGRAAVLRQQQTCAALLKRLEAAEVEAAGGSAEEGQTRRELEETRVQLMNSNAEVSELQSRVEQLKDAVTELTAAKEDEEAETGRRRNLRTEVAILAARLATRQADVDALFRANADLAHTNVRLQNEIDEMREAATTSASAEQAEPAEAEHLRHQLTGLEHQLHEDRRRIEELEAQLAEARNRSGILAAQLEIKEHEQQQQASSEQLDELTRLRDVEKLLNNTISSFEDKLQEAEERINDLETALDEAQTKPVEPEPEVTESAWGWGDDQQGEPQAVQVPVTSLQAATPEHQADLAKLKAQAAEAEERAEFAESELQEVRAEFEELMNVLTKLKLEQKASAEKINELEAKLASAAVTAPVPEAPETEGWGDDDWGTTETTVPPGARNSEATEALEELQNELEEERQRKEELEKEKQELNVKVQRLSAQLDELETELLDKIDEQERSAAKFKEQIGELERQLAENPKEAAPAENWGWDEPAVAEQQAGQADELKRALEDRESENLALRVRIDELEHETTENAANKSESEELLRELRAEVEVLRIKVEEAESEASQAKQQLERTEAEQKPEETEAEESWGWGDEGRLAETNDSEALQRAVEQLEGQIAILTSVAQNERENSEELLRELRAEVEVLRVKVEEAESEASQAKQQLERAEAQTAAPTEELETKICDIEEELERRAGEEKDLEAVRAELDAAKTKCALLMDSEGRLLDQVDEYGAQVETQQQVIKTLEAQLFEKEALEEKLAALEAELREEQAKGLVDDQHEEVEELRAALQQQETRIEALIGEKEELELKLKEAGARIEQVQKERDAAKSKYDELRAKLLAKRKAAAAGASEAGRPPSSASSTRGSLAVDTRQEEHNFGGSSFSPMPSHSPASSTQGSTTSAATATQDAYRRRRN